MMGRALLFSMIIHAGFIAGVYWSTHISLMIAKSKQQRQELSGAIEVDLLYKPTDTPMRQGTQRRELPPPQVRTKPEQPRPSAPSKETVRTPPPKTQPKPQAQAQPKPAPKAEPERDFRAVFDKLRSETGMEAEKAPREDNFPTREDGVAEARGTGGYGQQTLSAAQMALQAACRKHHQIPQAERMRREHPDVRGYINIRLVGSGNQLQLVSLQRIQSSGFPMLDQACENSIRKAIQQETFASDIVAELSGKENTITCQF